MTFFVPDATDPDALQGVSLQDVFEQKRKDFIERSKQRQAEAKKKAAERKEHPLSKTFASWKQSRGVNVSHKKSGM